MKRLFISAIILLILLLLNACSKDSMFQGISQDSNREAKVEQASMDLDNENYDAVISELSALYTTTTLDPKVAHLLASAYMGKAGLDTTLFVAYSGVTDLASTTTSSGTVLFDKVASLLSPPNITIAQNGGKTIDGKLAPDYLNYISDAQRILESLNKKGIATDDDRIQLGMASTAHFILHIGNNTANSLNPTLRFSDTNGQPGIVPVPINSSAYKSYRNDTSGAYNSWSIYVGAATFTESTTRGVPTSYQYDLTKVKTAIDAFSHAYPGSNKVKNNLNAFLYSALGIASDETVTDELIMAYTSSGIFDYVQRISNSQ